MKWFLSFWVMGVGLILSAREIVVGPQGISPFLDTEVSTNIAFNATRNDVREFNVRIDLAGTVSNGVQIAFGRDVDEDGDLAPEEMRLVLGWRCGRYFVEDVVGETRSFDASAETGRFLQMRVSTDQSYVPKTATFTNEVGACFADLTAACPPWLFCADWNLLKVTRRGTHSADEICRIDSVYRFFRFFIR